MIDGHMIFGTILVSTIILITYTIGLRIFLVGMEEMSHARGAKNWPTVDARLESCTVNARNMGRRRYWYCVVVEYSYVVAGVQYSGNNLAADHVGSEDRERNEMAQRRVLDMKPFVIRHHPRKPAVSAIFAPEKSWILATLVFGVVWLAAAIGMTAMSLLHSEIGRLVVDTVRLLP